MSNTAEIEDAADQAGGDRGRIGTLTDEQVAEVHRIHNAAASAALDAYRTAYAGSHGGAVQADADMIDRLIDDLSHLSEFIAAKREEFIAMSETPMCQPLQDKTPAQIDQMVRDWINDGCPKGEENHG